jgi:ribose/xylose/arabinose/galactoside ABC-type transport system permease subunit
MDEVREQTSKTPEQAEGGKPLGVSLPLDRGGVVGFLRRGLNRAPGSYRALGTLIALGLIWLFFTLKSEYFLTSENIFNIFLQASNVGIIAAGLTVVLITAEIDLSIGSLQALSGSVAAVVIIQHGHPLWLGIVAGLGATVLAGAISGLLTWKLKIVSFISTLAMLGIAQGVAFLLTNGTAIAGFGETYALIGTYTYRGFPGAAFIAIVVFVVIHLMLTRTKLGLQIYAVGGNREAAEYAGIRAGRVKLIALMISGLTAGIGGLILSSRLDAGNGLFGANDLLAAVAAVVIGGTSLFGGVGNVIGTAIGVVMIASINDGLILMNVPDFWQQIVIGCIIIAAMAVDQLTKAARLAVI